MMNSNSRVLNGVIVVALLALLALNGYLIYQSISAPMPPYTYTPSPTSSTQEPKQKIIRISGTGEASATPDIAVIYLAVKTQEETAAKAQSENAEIMTAVLAALKQEGIDESHIETLSYSLEPVTTYPDRGEEPRIVGYMCRNSIAVSVNDVSRAGGIVDVAVGAGINEVNSIQFRVSDQKMHELYEQSLKNAVTDADRQAAIMSKSLQVTIIGPVEVSIGPQYVPYATRYEAEYKAGTPIIPGEFKILVDVQVSYLYE
ncbi:SIMPL domain-containing protein [[Eubacterium] cellulosolvens]